MCALLLGFVSALYNHFDFGAKTKSARYKTLHITIPEDLDYTDVFETVLNEYTDSHELTMVKTTNMGKFVPSHLQSYTENRVKRKRVD